jgi:hypothetical protein
MNDIDRVLREDARVTLPGDGFSARVLGALPPRTAATRGWLTPALVFGSAALGSVLAIAFAPAGNSVLQGFADLVQLRGLTPAAITAVAMGVALLASALVLAVETD